jgi:A/G-specific adenine glycosylase
MLRNWRRLIEIGYYFDLKYRCGNQVVSFLRCIFHSKEVLENFPWRNLPNNKVSPWEVSIGEILLSRVNANRVLPIYESLVSKYASPCELSKIEQAKLEKILKPLGLQKKKASLLIEVSKIFCKEKDKERIEKALRKINGIGKNTYNAIMLFGFEEPVPLMDGVIGRVIERVFNKKWKGKAVTDKKAWLLSTELLSCIINEDLGDPKVFYYLLLDVGRNFCLRTNPKCKVCPCRQVCSYARNLSES